MTLSQTDPTGVLHISGALDIESANSLRESLLACFVSQPETTADLSGVEECDTAALQVLLGAQKDAASAGKSLRFVAISPALTITASALGFAFEAPAVSPEASYGR